MVFPWFFLCFFLWFPDGLLALAKILGYVFQIDFTSYFRWEFTKESFLYNGVLNHASWGYHGSIVRFFSGNVMWLSEHLRRLTAQLIALLTREMRSFNSGMNTSWMCLETVFWSMGDMTNHLMGMCLDAIVTSKNYIWYIIILYISTSSSYI